MTPAPEPQPAPGAGPPEGAEAPARTGLDALRQETQNEVDTAIARFVETFGRTVKSGDFDLAGKDEAAKDAVRVHLVEKLKNFFTENKSKAAEIIGSAEGADAQKLKNAFDEWMRAAGDFMQAEMESWGGMTWGEMGIPEAEAALAAMKNPDTTGKSGRKGVGNFEKWISTHATYGEAYRERTAHVAAAVTAKPAAEEALRTTTAELGDAATWPGFKGRLDKARSDIASADTPAKIAAATAELAAMRALRARMTPSIQTAQEVASSMRALEKVLPDEIKNEVNDLNTKIREATSDAEVDEHSGGLAAVKAKLQKFEPLIPYLTAPEIPETQRDTIARQVKDGIRTPEQAVADFERAKQAVQTQSSREFESGENAPFIDRAMDMIAKMPEGKWKKTVGIMLATVATLVASLARLPWVGSWIKGNLMSNRMLAARGDPGAKIALAAETEFSRFGLPIGFATNLGEGQTKDIVVMLADSDEVNKLTKNPKEQAALAQLRTQLEERGGALSDMTLYEFMGNNPEWTGIAYKPGSAGTTAVAAAPTPASALTTAPAPAPTAAAPATPAVAAAAPALAAATTAASTSAATSAPASAPATSAAPRAAA